MGGGALEAVWQGRVHKALSLSDVEAVKGPDRRDMCWLCDICGTNRRCSLLRKAGSWGGVATPTLLPSASGISWAHGIPVSLLPDTTW